MDTFLQNVINALQWGSFYALIALGYSMVYGVLMLFNFAHGDIFMVGSYIGFFIATGLISLASMGFIQLPGWVILILTLLLAMTLTSIVGVLVYRIGYRPLRNAPRASAAITGLMIGIILETGNLSLLGASRKKFPEIIPTTVFQIGNISITDTKILIVLVSILLMFAMHQFVQHSKWGMAMRASAYDFVIVPLMGVSADNIAAITFALGSALAAAAGVFYGMAYPILDPYMGIEYGWKSFVAAILGGRGSVIGTVIAGFLMGFLDIFVATYFPSTMRNLISFSIILIILTFRPHGFFGQPHSAQLRL
ncbi:MAG: branched-chain amino acid ABC transporter permease [Chloroflexi bacterium]|nr:branched-chain amino acid ABC transporter permease [Chloroflexota bacterium]